MKNTPQRHGMTRAFLHQFNILFQNIRPVEPLLRVIVPTVK